MEEAGINFGNANNITHTFLFVKYSPQILFWLWWGWERSIVFTQPFRLRSIKLSYMHMWLYKLYSPTAESRGIEKTESGYSLTCTRKQKEATGWMQHGNSCLEKKGKKIIQLQVFIHKAVLSREAPGDFQNRLKILSKLIYFEVSSALSRCLCSMNTRSHW